MPKAYSIKAVLHQYGRTDWVILRASTLTDEQYHSYLQSLPEFSFVNKWVLCGRLRSDLLVMSYPFFTSNLATLTSLDLRNNRLGPSDVASLTQALCLNQNTVLSVLRLGGNPLKGAGVVEVLKAALHEVATLSVVDVSMCDVDDDACPAISHQIRSARYSGPFYLNLSKNKIGAAGTVVLGRGLPSVVSLSLCRNVPPGPKRIRED